MPVFFWQAMPIVTLILICSGFSVSLAQPYSTACSQRIEVYSLSQNYWDTQQGDTLSAIVLHLLPNNPAKHEALMQDIVQLNPDAFIGGNPEKLLAGKRLRLPGYMQQADTAADPDRTIVERYSWGNIKRPRE